MNAAHVSWTLGSASPSVVGSEHRLRTVAGKVTGDETRAPRALLRATAPRALLSWCQGAWEGVLGGRRCLRGGV